MELSKRALGFLCRQYSIILRQNRLSNTLGTFTLSTLMCASMCGAATFVAPENAMAAKPKAEYFIDNDALEWTSDADISQNFSVVPADNVRVADFSGVYAGGDQNDSITVTLQSGHTITVTNRAKNTDSYVQGLLIERNNNTFYNYGTIEATGRGTDTNYLSAGAMNANGVTNTVTNAGSFIIKETTTDTDTTEAYGICARGSGKGSNALTITNTLTNTGDIKVTAQSTIQTLQNRWIEVLATGMRAHGDANTMNNSGYIQATSSAMFGGVPQHHTWISSAGMDLYGDNSTATNEANGVILVEAKSDAFVDTYGIYAEGKNATIINDGSVIATTTVTVTEATEKAEAYGLSVWGNISTITNQGIIEAHVTSTAPHNPNDINPENNTYGICGWGNESILTNTETITVTTTAKGDAYEADAFAIYAEGNRNALHNTGALTVIITAKGDVDNDADGYGLYTEGNRNILTNSGSIFVSSSATGKNANAKPFAYGIKADDGDRNTLINEKDGVIDIIATSAYAEAVARGMYANGDKALIINDGVLTVRSVNTSKDANAGGAEACGMYAEDASEFINNGTLSVEAVTQNGDTYAYGIKVEDDGGKISITNSGTIDVIAAAKDTKAKQSSADAYGIYIDDNTTLTNYGIINATTKLEMPARDAYTYTYGIKADDDNTVNNSGTINAMITVQGPISGAYVHAYGIVVDDDSIVNNSGTINAIAKTEGDTRYADAYAHGIYTNDDDNTIQNAGIINATAITKGSARTADVYARGIKADDGNTIQNSGIINATAISEGATRNVEIYAYGIKADKKNDINNSGTINVIATTDSNEKSYVSAYGIRTDEGERNTLTNEATGIINVSAETVAGTTITRGLFAYKGNIVSNYGEITVSAKSVDGDTEAYGMVMSDSGRSIFNNYGTINVSAISTNGTATAYQAYVDKGTARIGTWALKLGESYGGDTGYYVFGVDKGAKLQFGTKNNEGAKLIITSIEDGGFRAGEEYKISDMIGGEGKVIGHIESVSSAFALLNVELVDGGTADDYSDQSIVGTSTVTGDNSPAQAAANHAVGGAKGHMNSLSKILGAQRVGSGGQRSGMRDDRAQSDTATMYADAGTSFTDAGGSYVTPESPLWKAFLMPFYSTTAENGGAYDTNIGGLVVGASRPVGDDFTFGFHASLSKANSNSDYTDSNAISYALGVNGVYNVDESLYFRGQLTGFLSESDIDMVSSTGALAQKASADMNTYAIYAELAAGYDIALAPEHVLTPEIALSYMYAHMKGFDSAFIGDTSTSFSMDSENYGALYADASLRWTGAFDLGKKENGSALGMLKPTVKAGIRQALTDPEISSTMTIFGSSATTHADANETAFTCEAGLVWDMGDVNTSLTYSGEFGNVEYSHMGMFKVEWEF